MREVLCVEGDRVGLSLERARTFYEEALTGASSLAEAREEDDRAEILRGIDATLEAVTARELHPDDAFLVAQACSLQGMARLELATDEGDQESRSTLLRSGTMLLDRAMQGLASGLPGSAALFIPDSLAALAEAMAGASPEDQAYMADRYGEGFVRYFLSLEQVLSLREQAASARLQAEVLLAAAAEVGSPSDRSVVLQEAAALSEQAAQLFWITLDREAADQALEVGRRARTRLSTAGPVESQQGVPSESVPSEAGQVDSPSADVSPAPAPVPPASLGEADAAEEEWFYALGEVQSGPVPRRQVVALLTSGQMAADDLVWREGMAGWTAAAEAGLVPPPQAAPLPQAAPPPPPQADPAPPPPAPPASADATAPPATAAEVSDSWYMGRDDERYGPYTLEQLRGFAAEGRLTPDDLVWHQGLPDWVTLAEAQSMIPGLR
jgi:hypothetical protein